MRLILIKKLSNLKNILILSSIWLFHMIINYTWLKKDAAPLIWDAHFRFMESLKFLNAYKNLSLNFWSNILKATDWHPPFVSLIIAPLYFIFGNKADIAVMLNSAIFLFILILCVYKIGGQLVNEKVGILAAFFITMYPLIFNQLRIYMLDIPLAGMVSLCIYLLLKTDDFKSFKFSLFLGIAMGLGMLIKINFIGYLIGPLGIMLYKSIKDSKINKKQITNISLSFSISFLISSLFYIPKINWVSMKIFSFDDAIEVLSHGSTAAIKAWHFISMNFQNILYTFREIMNNSITFFFSLIFLFSLTAFFKIKFKYKSLLLFWIIIPFFLIISVYCRYLTGASNIRYVIPLLPSFALISAIGIYQIKPLWLRRTVIIISVLFGILQLFAISFGIKDLPAKISLFSINIFNQDIYIPSSHFSHPSQEQKYCYDEDVLNTLLTNTESLKTIKVAFLPDTTEIWAPLAYKIYIRNLSIKLFYNVEDLCCNKPIPPRQFILNSDYVILKDGGWLTIEHLLFYVKEAMAIFQKNINKFHLIKKIMLPDNSNLLIYKKL